MWVSQAPRILVNPAMTLLPYFIRDPLYDSWKNTFQMSPLHLVESGSLWASVLFRVFPPVVDPGQKLDVLAPALTVSTAP